MSEIRYIEDVVSYDALLGGTTPVLVDFTASWCGPCKRLAPVLEQVGQELGGRVDIVKVDIDALPSIPARYGVQGVPTMMLFEGGELLAKLVGAKPRGDILDTLTPLL